MSIAATLEFSYAFRDSPPCQFGTLPILPLLAFQRDCRNAIPRMPGFRRTRMVPHVGGFPYSQVNFNTMSKIHLKGIPCKSGSRWTSSALTSNSNPEKCTCLKCLKTLPFRVYRIKDRKFMGGFRTRKDAVYFCKVEQTLPLPNCEWEDEFEIREA